MTRLDVEQVTVSYGSKDVLSSVDLRIEGNEIVGVIGPNGSGKSTLLRMMSRVLRPRLGRALLDDRDLYVDLSAAETARNVAVVSQETSIAFEFTCAEIVLMGRSPHVRRFHAPTTRDLEVVNWAMQCTDTWTLRDRPISRVSGGERQRVILARAFAQEPRLLLLDEPSTHLDVGHEVRVMQFVRSLGCSVVAVLHDLNLAATYCSRLILLDRGRVVADGAPRNVLDPHLLEEVYGIPFLVDKIGGRSRVAPSLS